MAGPLLKSSCCGCSLRTGSQVIAIITLIPAGIVMAIATIIALITGYLIATGAEAVKRINDDFSSTYGNTYHSTAGAGGMVDTLAGFGIFILLLILLIVGLFLAVNVYNLIGINDEKPLFMLPWLILAGISVFCMIINFFSHFFAEGFCVSVYLDFVITGTWLYAFLIELSYFMELKQ